MGSGHVKMALGLWWAGCSAAALLDARPPVHVLLVGGAVCAGTALWNDIDHEDSTVANSAGPVTRFLARRMVDLSAAAYRTTATPLDNPHRNPHRTLTHTTVFAVLCGLTVFVVAKASPVWVAAALTTAVTTLAARAGLPPSWWRLRINMHWAWRRLFGPRYHRFGIRRRLALPVPLLLGAGVGAMTWQWAAGGDWWLGVAVTAGMLLHNAGDGMTNSATPAAWPWRIRGQAWYRCGLPQRLRFDTGGQVELEVVQPAFVLLIAATGGYLMWPAGLAAYRAVEPVVDQVGRLLGG